MTYAIKANGGRNIRQPKPKNVSLIRLIFRLFGRSLSELIAAVSTEPAVVPENHILGTTVRTSHFHYAALHLNPQASH